MKIGEHNKLTLQTHLIEPPMFVDFTASTFFENSKAPLRFGPAIPNAASRSGRA
jgi:hypothetical protein